MQYSMLPSPTSKTNMHRNRDFKANCDILSKKLIDKGYKKAEIYYSISKPFGRNRADLLTLNNESKYRIQIIN